MLRLPQFLQGLRPHADLIETEAKVSTSCEEARRFASLRSMGETRHVNDKDNVEAEGRGFTVPHIVPKVVDVSPSVRAVCLLFPFPSDSWFIT
jgi:hypothetical protein